MDEPFFDRLSRRDAIRAMGLAAGLASVGGLGGLGGCASHAPSTPLGGVGDPIPGDPSLARSSQGRAGDGADPIARSSSADALHDWRNRHSTASSPTADRFIPEGVIPRSSWAKAPPVVSLSDPLGRITRITVHHEGSDPFYATSASASRDRIERIRRAHRSNGWADIGYHYVIDPAGRIYQARPISLQGAHVKYNNEHNLGVVLLGNFEEQTPTRAAVSSLESFLASQMSQYRVPLRSLHTHQELRPTLCPGMSLQSRMVVMRRDGGSLAHA